MEKKIQQKKRVNNNFPQNNNNRWNTVNHDCPQIIHRLKIRKRIRHRVEDLQPTVHFHTGWTPVWWWHSHSFSRSRLRNHARRRRSRIETRKICNGQGLPDRTVFIVELVLCVCGDKSGSSGWIRIGLDLGIFGANLIGELITLKEFWWFDILLVVYLSWRRKGIYTIIW